MENKTSQILKETANALITANKDCQISKYRQTLEIIKEFLLLHQDEPITGELMLFIETAEAEQKQHEQNIENIKQNYFEIIKK